jgi:hypothetical protein
MTASGHQLILFSLLLHVTRQIPARIVLMHECPQSSAIAARYHPRLHSRLKFVAA